MRRAITKIILGLSLASMPVLTVAATINASDLFARTVGKNQTIQWVNKTVYKKLVRFKKGVKILGTLTVANLHVTDDTTFDNPISSDMVEPIDTQHTAVYTENDYVEGFIKYKELKDDALQELLDGNSNVAFTFDENDIVFDVIFSTTSTDTSATVDIGTDDNWADQGSDPDAFIADHNMNSSTATISRMSTADSASQTGAALSMVAEDDSSTMIIQSSSDMTDDTLFSGRLIVLYANQE